MNVLELLESEKYKKAELKKYPSLKALSGATGLPANLLKLAKNKGFNGFNQNNSVDWQVLKPVFENGITDLLKDVPKTMEAVKIELAKLDMELKKLQIRKLERNLIEPNEVKQFLVELAAKHSQIIKTELGELPPKLLGKPEPEIKEAISKSMEKIFQVMQEGESAVDNLSNESGTKAGTNQSI